MRKEVTIDIETDGLKPTVIWCACVSGGLVFYDKQAFQEYLNELEPSELYAHNGIGFDYPVLSRLWSIDFSRHVLRDTLVLSRLANPSRFPDHRLVTWGLALGFAKGEYEDWSQLTPEMVAYCHQDVLVAEKTLEALKSELIGFSQDSIDLEHDVAFVIQGQRDNGWKLDVPYAYELYGVLKERQMTLQDNVQAVFKPLPAFVKQITPKFKKDDSMSVVGLKFLGDSWAQVAGTFSRIDYPIFELGSGAMVAKHLMHYGWEPVHYTKPTDSHPKGSIKTDEATLAEVEGIPEVDLINEYNMIRRRATSVMSWLDAVDDKDRVHGRVNSNGAVTGRMTHSKPNVAQVTAKGKPYGEEARRCWIVADGYSLVGMDASGLELRMLAHYMDDPEYTREILEGDVHTANMKAAGFNTREQAKTFIYTFLYGAGDAKIGSIVGGSMKEGRALKTKFINAIPALKSLKDRVAIKVPQGYLLGLDGRKVYIRSEHAALNTLLQSAGAIVMKKALTTLDEYSKLWNIDHRFVGNIHDEVQTEVLTRDAHKFGRLAVACIQSAGIHFNMKCPLNGEYKVGQSWAETH